ncbi:hypothetical protein TSTA_091580 [Talaromyces stipitatus ATCC 10500]|uniref:Uncharacterized protein n=1 Tax=Talaromyces stipitatus (strain ATCC 10500 / CBS 375.48 / QM 6759 / NRRL 1006) TaxID=441959 RepID=B8M2K6_TALSN|nr:uncharacterized protein TSTA_091580 [Talaromyces stipitatus ATCC 10500]EED21917.1 hypothetical protein TSTA_091580 [Talaromyces stipitatus ATCC 10500]
MITIQSNAAAGSDWPVKRVEMVRSDATEEPQYAIHAGAKRIDLSLCVYPAVYPAAEGNLNFSTVTFATSAEKVPFTPTGPAVQEQQKGNQARQEASRALNGTSSWAAEPYEDISPGIVGSASSIDFVENPLQGASNLGVDVIGLLPTVYDARVPIGTARNTQSYLAI